MDTSRPCPAQVLSERVDVRVDECLAAAREGYSFWAARCALSKRGFGDGAPLVGCPRLPDRPRCAWPVSERGPVAASLCPRRLALASAALAALYATFARAAGGRGAAVEALALLSLCATACGAYCYFLALTVDPGRLKDVAAGARAYAAALEALARDATAPASSPLILHHRAKVAGPLRSRWDPQQRAVLLDFDHYCVFLRRPVARGNYGAFLGVVAAAFVSSTAIVVAACLAAAAKHGTRASAVVDELVAVYFAFFVVFFGQLLALHLYLALRRLTTFELMAAKHHSRPSYLDFVDNDLHYAQAPATCARRVRGDSDALPDLAPNFARPAQPAAAPADGPAPLPEPEGGAHAEFTI